MHKPLFTLLLLVAAITAQAQQKKQPNIIVIIADDLGWNDVGFHNPNIVSPNLNQLARKGVELTRFYVASICSPTRAGLLTGKYPDRFGIRNGVIRPNMVGGLPLEEKTLANILATAGYKTRGAFGKWHLGHSDVKYHPLQRGFTSFYGHYNGAIDYFTHYRDGALDWHRNYEASRDTGYSVELIGREVAGFIRSAGEGPFFAYVAFNGVHSPLQAREQDLLKNGYNAAKAGENDAAEGDYGKRGKGNNQRQTFAAMVTGMDEAIGNILKALDEKGVADNTLIWFLSDNGGTPKFGGNNKPLRGTKNTEWEGGVRSTSVVYWKGHLEGGRKSSAVAGFIDVVPTLAQIAGASGLPAVDGKDVLAALRGQPTEERVFFLGREAVVSGRWKLNEGQLFDLEKDPSETTNVAAANPAEFRRLNEALAGFKKFVIPMPFPFQREGWTPPKDWAIPDAPVAQL